MEKRLKWNAEWIDLQNIERMVSECWRLNDSQLKNYANQLREKQDLIFAGSLGIIFLKLIDGMLAGRVDRDWSRLQKDAKQIRHLIQQGTEWEKEEWEQQYQRLSENRVFYTQLGQAFLNLLAERLELHLSIGQRQMRSDIRQIQEICEQYQLENEEQFQAAALYLRKNGKGLFSSWLGRSFAKQVQDKSKKKRWKEKEADEREEEGLEGQADPQPEKRGRRFSWKLPLVIILLSGVVIAGIWVLSQMDREQLQSKLRQYLPWAEARRQLDNDTLFSVLGMEDENDSGDEDEIDTFWDAQLPGRSLGSVQNGGALSVRNSAKQLTQVFDEEQLLAGNAKQADSDRQKTQGSIFEEALLEGAPASEEEKQKEETKNPQAEQSPATEMASAKEGTKTASAKEGTKTASAKEETKTASVKEDSKVDTQPNTGKTAKVVEKPEVIAKYRSLVAEYPDVYGWLKIPGTEIDQPVMQCKEDTTDYFYLHHNYQGIESAAGSLFVDRKSTIFPQDQNTVIYGHNMQNGHNFGILSDYEDPAFYQEHTRILFNTIYEEGEYEVIAVVKTRVLYQEEQGFRYYYLFNYENRSQFQACKEFIRQNQLYDTGKKLRKTDQTIMLSTCEYSRENGRLVVIARKIKS